LNQTVGADDEGELGDLFADREAADPFEGRRSRCGRRVFGARSTLCGAGTAQSSSCGSASPASPGRSEAIGHELDLTRERVRQLEGQAARRLGAPRPI